MLLLLSSKLLNDGLGVYKSNAETQGRRGRATKARGLHVSVFQGRSNPIWLRFAAITGLLLLAWLLRLFQIEAQSIWWDEGISLHLATSSLGELVADRLNNVHPPLYFVFLKGWVSVVGESAFSGRYLSALASLLQVVVAFTLMAGRQGKGKQAAWLAAVLVAISPLSVIYAQEIRVYSLLPLVYLGMLLAAEREWRSQSTAALVALALLEWIALHLHYISVFAVAYVALWGLWKRRGGVGSGEWRVASEKRESQSPNLPVSQSPNPSISHSLISNLQSPVFRWLLAHILVALASLPWFAAVFFNRAAVQSEANAGTFATEPVPLDYLFPQVWAFHLTGLANALARPFIGWVAGIAAVALIIAFLVARVGGFNLNPQLRFRFGKPGYKVEFLLQWLLPLSSALVVWSVRSFSHPRYVIIFAIALFPLLAVLIAPVWQRPRHWLGWLRRGAALVLGASVLYLSLWGLGQYFFNPNVAKPDMRGVARFLQTTAQPDDLIVIPNTDWSLPFEYQGSTPITMAPPATCRLPPATCHRWLFSANQPRHAFAVDYPQGTRDWQGRTTFELERQGAFAATYPFDDLLLREYRLGVESTAVPDCQEAAEPAIIPIGKRFGSLLLRSAWMEQGAAADTAVTLTLCWELEQPITERYSVAMRLLDEEGWLVSQADAPLVDSYGRPTEQWPGGAAVTTYHVLPLAIGTPPLAYPLAISVYSGSGEAIQTVEITDEQGTPQGQQVKLGSVALSPPQFNEAGRPVHNPYALPEPRWLAAPVQVTAGLQLVAAEFGRGPYLPGEAIPLYLTWKAAQAGLAHLVPEVVVEQEGETLVVTGGRLLAEQYPTSQWQAGEIVRERRMVDIPLSAAPGEATLTVRLEDFEERLEGIEIAAAERLEALPADANPVEATFGEVAQLIGYSLSETTVNADEGVAVTLYWQALQTGGDDYTVFVHLVDEDGRLIGQHDGRPVEGQRPTNTWITGDLLADRHLVMLHDPAYRGSAKINVGLYDPQTGQRVLLSNGSDFFQLPADFMIRD